jgi:methyltransferase-like protein
MQNGAKKLYYSTFHLKRNCSCIAVGNVYEDSNVVHTTQLYCLQELLHQNQALEAFNGTLDMFNEQLRICEGNQGKVAPQDTAK